MPNWRGYDYTYHMPGGASPEESLMTDTGRVQATVQVRDWENRLEAVKAFAGYSYVDSVGGILRVLRRVTPHPWPDLPWVYAMGATRAIGGSPKGPDPVTRLPRYRMGAITLQYSALSYDILEDDAVLAEQGPLVGLPDEGDALRRGVRRYVTKHRKRATRTYTIPNGFLYYTDDKSPVPQGALGFTEHYAIITWIWHQVPVDAIPYQHWAAATNAVNLAAFDGHDAGTLLLSAPDERPVRLADGTRAYDIIYEARWLPRVGLDGVAKGHNSFPRQLTAGPNTGKLDYVPVTTRGPNFAAPAPLVGGSPPYSSFDFPLLFAPYNA
jgi:hypothetical protein